MKAAIKYCQMCGGRGEADQAAEELRSRFGIEVAVVDVGKGRFEVEVEGQELFSKAKTGRFPLPGELYKLLRAANSGARFKKGPAS